MVFRAVKLAGTAANQLQAFTIIDTKLFVSVVTFSTQDNTRQAIRTIKIRF